MSGLVLKLRQPPAIRLDLGGILPSKLAGHSNGAIEHLHIASESGQGKIGDFFSVSGSADEHITIEGSTRIASTVATLVIIRRVYSIVTSGYA